MLFPTHISNDDPRTQRPRLLAKPGSRRGGTGHGERRECRPAYEQHLGSRRVPLAPHAAFPLLTWLAASPDFLTMKPIIPIRRKEPFDGDGWLFELKLDGFRGIANTVQGRMLRKNFNPLKRFRHLLDALPPGYVFDGEIVALDGDGR